jgi:hypothetical protein
VNVKGTLDTPYEAFSGEIIVTFRVGSSEARKLAFCRFVLVEEIDTQDV